jgi:hypothetical protein
MKIINLVERPNWDYQRLRVLNQFLDLSAVHTYVDGAEDTVGIRPDGEVQFVVLRSKMNHELEQQALEVSRSVYDPGSAARRVVAAGYVIDPKASSVVLGYMERHRHQPYARATSLTLKYPEKFGQILPYMQHVDRLYRDCEWLKEIYTVQQAAAAKTKSCWLIPGTVSTTLTVNQDWRTACHPDEGNLHGAFSALTCMASGLTGGELIWPRWGVAIPFGNGDVIFGNFHELHCNARFVEEPGEFERIERITLVQYFREKMTQCGTPKEERDRVKMM